MIIIDTNVLLAFLLTNGITRRIITENPDIFSLQSTVLKHFRKKIFGDRIKVLFTKDVTKLVSFD